MSDGTSTQKLMVTALQTVFPAAVYTAIAPDNPAAPYCVYMRVTSTPERTLSSGNSIECGRYQVDVYATTYDQAHQLAQTAKEAMLGIAYPITVTIAMEQDLYDADVKLHRVLQEYSIFSPRSF